MLTSTTNICKKEDNIVMKSIKKYVENNSIKLIIIGGVIFLAGAILLIITAFSLII